MTPVDHPLSREDALQMVTDALHRIAPEIDLAASDHTAPLQDELDLDSMDLLALVTALSERLGAPIPDRDTAELTSVDALVTYLVTKAG
jgi:acyl carrier protein